MEEKDCHSELAGELPSVAHLRCSTSRVYLIVSTGILHVYLRGEAITASNACISVAGCLIHSSPTLPTSCINLPSDAVLSSRLAVTLVKP
jgi:hypothetical protein